MTVQEIIQWVEDERDDAKRHFQEEPNKNSNHLATAYLAEFEFCERLLDFIKEGIWEIIDG